MPIFALLVGLSLPFWFISFITHAITNVAQQKPSSWKDIIEYAPHIGWRTKTNLNDYYLAVDNEICHVVTDSEGWLGKSSLSESEIVVFGDSFAFGYGVDFRDAYFNLNPNLRVKAFGAPGYNMVQELLLMQRFSFSLAKKLVIWFICLENDLYDNLRPHSHHLLYRTPFVRRVQGTSEWEIISSHVNPTKWAYASLNGTYAETFAKLCTPCPLSQHIYSSCEFLIREGHDTCAKADAQLAVMTIPNKLQLTEQGKRDIASQLPPGEAFDSNLPDQRFEKICRTTNVHFVPGKRYLSADDYKTYDWHWTKQGHRQMAKLVSDLYNVHKSDSLHGSPLSG